MDISIKGDLLNISLRAKMIDEIIASVKTAFPNLLIVKGNIQLIVEICRIIELTVLERRLKLDKLELFFTIYEGLFGILQPTEKVMITSVIGYLNDKSIFKPKSRFRRFLKRVARFFRKK